MLGLILLNGKTGGKRPSRKGTRMSTEVKESELIDVLNQEEVNKRHAPKKRRPPRQPLSAFSKTAVVILLVMTSFMIFLGLGVRQPLVLIIAGIELLIVTLIVSGIRWAPVLSSILGGLTLLVFTSATGYPIHHLTHPKDAFGYGVQTTFSFVIFILMLVVFWSAVMLILTGISAVIHNYVQRERRQTPRWFYTALAAALGVFFGAFILGALAQPTPGVASANSNTVHLYPGNFSQTSTSIAKGSKLTLIDDGTYHHNISTGRWINGQPAIASQPGEPTVLNKDISTANATLVIGPFNTAGTYYLMCSVHHNMMLTVTVQ
jgi:plastocyanin